MKKFAMVASSFLLAGALFAFAGCDMGSSAKVSGDYKEATAADVSTALEEVDTDKTFVDTTADEWKYGLQLNGNMDVNISMKMTMGEKSESASAKVKGDANYKLSMKKTADAFDVAGQGGINANMESKGMGSQDANEKIGINAYNDSAYVYLTNKYPEKGEDAKVKLNLESVLDEIMGNLPLAEGDVPTEGAEGAFDIDLGAMVNQLTEMGFKIAMDKNDGLKIKLSADKNTLFSLIAGSGVGDSTITAVLEGIDFKNFTCDVYLAFDKDMKFNQLSLDMNIEGSMKEKEEALGMSMEANVKAKCTFVLKAFDGTVTLPNGIATDTSYVEESM